MDQNVKQIYSVGFFAPTKKRNKFNKKSNTCNEIKIEFDNNATLLNIIFYTPLSVLLLISMSKSSSPMNVSIYGHLTM